MAASKRKKYVAERRGQKYEYFHLKATHRKAINRICSIQNMVGHVVTFKKDIREVFTIFFTNIYKQGLDTKNASIYQMVRNKITL